VEVGFTTECDQRLFLLASSFFCLAKSLWNQGSIPTGYTKKISSIFKILIPAWWSPASF
jgi:hypothetical protein